MERKRWYIGLGKYSTVEETKMDLVNPAQLDYSHYNRCGNVVSIILSQKIVFPCIVQIAADEKLL